ncbi:rhodanese-like domain-containing protein [Marasmitruncus massiliensis]|jgi:rhodanese-related sulfurtransferase|uniref:rhodanese-like domain-containing protein n=1 Tax=Marasmitruncus massiliensis TaxID=1944642 RepID=UPI000C7AADEB|nr:rhodanese-like domain-containing protein [Marasmitruncus massiliensis]MBE6907713.1 rhodanese-like domain-containing protein [Oscillospiraceae bacterium]
MKKLAALLVSLALASSLFAGCGSKPSEASSAPASSAEASSSEAASSEPASSDAGSEGSDVVTAAAMGYFENFDKAKIMKSVSDFFAAIDAGEDMFVLDVRQPDAYAEGHIKGAVNMPFGPAVAEGLSLIPDDKQVYVYCYTGQTASQVTALLNVAGKFAANVQLGFDNGISKAEGYEKYIDKEAVPVPTDTYDVDPAIQEAITKYFSDVEAAKGTAFANFNFKADSLKEVLDAEDDSYFVYSIRSAEDYAKGHIPTAVNNPFGQGMQAKFSELPTDKTIIVQCYTGQTSSQTTAILRLLGYNAYSLHGGMGSAESGAGWLGAGYEVVTD